MHVAALRLHQFRSHEATEVTFDPGVNLLHGPNGAGKTNVLEALHYLCLAKSFLTGGESHALRKGAPFFEVEGTFHPDRGGTTTARLAYVPGEGKRIFVNGAPLDRLVDVVGQLPVVIISPDDQRLTDGGPDERRRFLDTILCQARPTYLDALLRYRRALKQRNELLGRFRGRSSGPPRELRASWDAELVRHGARITHMRARFLVGFTEKLAEAFGHIEAVGEKPTIEYRTQVSEVSALDEAGITEAFTHILQDYEVRENERGLTLVGPHRDELVFRLNAMQVRRYASQGQHRTFVIALKMAQYFYIADRLEEKPILLLDDVFDHLDPSRIRIFARLISEGAVGQSLVTAARPDVFRNTVLDGGGHRAIPVFGGTVHPAATPFAS